MEASASVTKSCDLGRILRDVRLRDSRPVSIAVIRESVLALVIAPTETYAIATPKVLCTDKNSDPKVRL